MGIGPITYLEIEAMCSARLVTLEAWDKALIRRVDDAVRAVIAGNAPARQNTAVPAQSKQIPFSDTARLNAFFKNVAAQKEIEKGASNDRSGSARTRLRDKRRRAG